ncbi:AraC family transcriptional regulator [Halomonas sp. 328]|uniref:AraC family transcriptional regulator n=1 Tax=Halomonas sp. 328 TaxID=2776704 RepID=UPI0018A7A482|nr:AraC family transcriptional regulator [Halomonas sp. 328]MBF8221482.1 AraC family transcriptional regulator [Halomonas sp. 328]
MVDDPLSELLAPHFLGSEFYHAAKHCGDWLLSHEQPVAPSFHLVTEGRCTLALPGGERRHLEAGDLVFFPGDGRHQLCALPDERGRPVRELALASRRPGVGLLCGRFRFRDELTPPWFRLLPDALALTREERDADWDALLKMLTQELSQPLPGGRHLALALANALLIRLLRHCLSRGLLDLPTLMAYHDPLIRQVLTLLHQAPEREWPLAELAHRVGLSRSALCERFHRQVGMPVRRYQVRLRMEAADRRLARGDSVLAASLAVGYCSEAAFRRAYKRVRGHGPTQQGGQTTLDDRA